MPLEVACPNCKSVLRAPEEAVGKKVKCKKCEFRFVIPGGKLPPGSVADSQMLSVVEFPASKLETPPRPGPLRVAALIADPIEVLQPDDEPMPVVGRASEPVAARVVAAVAGTSVDPFAFDGTPAKNGKKVDSKATAAVVPAAAGGGDAFAFDAGPAPTVAPDDAEDDAKVADKKSRPRKDKAKSGGGKKLVLILAAAVGMICLGFGGATAAVYFFVVQKVPTSFAEVDAAKAPPPVAAEAAAKGDAKARDKDKLGKEAKAPNKGSEKEKPKEKEPADPRPGIPIAPKPPKVALIPPTAPEPPAMTAPTFVLPKAPAGKTELVAKKKETISLELPAAAVRGVRFASADPPVAAVLWRSVEGFQGAGAKDTVDIYATRTLRRSDRVDFSADGFTGSRAFDVSPGGDRIAIEGPPGKLTVYDVAKKEAAIDGIDPFAGAAGRVLPITAIRFVTPDSVAVFDAAGSIDVYNVASKDRTSSSPAAPPLDKKAPAAVSDVVNGKVFVFVRGTVTPYSPATGASAGPAIPIGDPEIVPLGVAVDPTGKRVAVAYRATKAEPPHALTIVSLTGAKALTLPLPVDFGIPTGVRFAGSDAAVVVLGNDSSALLYDLEGNAMVGYLKRPGEPAVQIPDGTPGRYWWIVPDPTDPKKSVFATIEMPFDDYFKLAGEAKGDKKLHYLVPRADGLGK